jgi:hypothetical protein
VSLLCAPVSWPSEHDTGGGLVRGAYPAAV